MSYRRPGVSEGPDPPKPPTHLPGVHRRRRSLMLTVCLVFALGVAGVASDVRRVFGGASNATPWVTADDSARIVSPTYAYEFSGLADDPLQRPVGICVSEGFIYVADSLAGHIAVFRDGGSPQSPIGVDRLQVPVDIACDPASDELLVTDRESGALFAFRTDGSFIETITPTPSAEETAAPSPAWAPIAVTYADDSTIYVTDVSGDRHRVWHLARSGEILGVFPGESAEEDGPTLTLDFPNGVVASGERVWVADSNNRRLIELDPAGGVVRSLPLGRLIRGLAMLPPSERVSRPHFALIDAFSHEVVLVSDVGTEVGTAGTPGSGQGGLSFPNDVAATPTGLYIADTGNARIQVFEWAPARAVNGLVWPGGPSWIGLLSAPLLLAPLALVRLVRPVRVVASREALDHLRVAWGPRWHWRRVQIVLTPSVAHRARHRPGPPAEVSEYSHTDAAALDAQFELGETNAQILSLALRHRTLLSEDPVLTTVAAGRGVEVLSVAAFIEEFAVPTAPDDDFHPYGDTEENDA